MSNIRGGTWAAKRGGPCNYIPVIPILVAARYYGSSYSLTIAIAGHIKRFTMSKAPHLPSDSRCPRRHLAISFGLEFAKHIT
jgi:hypothetical protein